MMRQAFVRGEIKLGGNYAPAKALKRINNLRSPDLRNYSLLL